MSALLRLGKRYLPVFLLIAAVFWLSVGAAASGEGPTSSDRPLYQQAVELPKPTRTQAAAPATSETPTPTALPALVPERLTQGGCCPYPSWSQDSEWVLFFDRPSQEVDAGLYGVPVDGGEVTLIHGRVGVYSRNYAVVAYRGQAGTVIERWADGAAWIAFNDNRRVQFSPSAKSVVWIVTSHGISFPDVRQRGVWLATEDDPEGREIVTVNGGTFVGWTHDEEALIVTGRLSPNGPAGVWRIAVENGAGRLLMEAENVRSPLLSPDGGWVAFLSTFNADPDRDGLWALRTDGVEIKKVPFFGAYRWRREGELLVIPVDLDGEGLSLWQVDVSTLETHRLTDRASTHLPIANNDWSPSPDGEKMVFLSSEDRNLWLLALPEP